MTATDWTVRLRDMHTRHRAILGHHMVVQPTDFEATYDTVGEMLDMQADLLGEIERLRREIEND